MSKATYAETAVVADPTVPAIHIYRDFTATPEQLFRAHTDPEVFAQWIGPGHRRPTVTRWDAADGGSFRYQLDDGSGVQSFRGSFHTVRADRLVQTFTWEGKPDDVALQTMTFEDLGDGRTRLHALSLCATFEARDGWLRSGMEVGVNDGYAKLDGLLADRSL